MLLDHPLYELSGVVILPKQQLHEEISRVILNDDARARLLNLAPRVLFHGTRYLVPILMHDELSLSHETYEVSLTPDPEEAAQHAARGPRPSDDGRGAIIALDWTLLADGDPCCLSNGDEPNDWATTEPIWPVSQFIVGVFWLDALAPGCGLGERVPCSEPPLYPAFPYRGFQERTWEQRGRMTSRGVSQENIGAFLEFMEGATYGEVEWGPSGLPRHSADNKHATTLPGIMASQFLQQRTLDQ